jgi:hypothetical protein
MNTLKRSWILAAALAVVVFSNLGLAGAKPPAKPADLAFSVSPEIVAAGEEATITLRIEPISGVKINRYPKIKLQIPGQEGLVGEGYAEIGNAKPPPPDKMDTNYYKTVDPVELTLKLDGKAKSGKHKVEGKLTYFYCVTASGFCAPARVPVEIPIAVR